MTGPKRNSEFCFPETLNVPQGEPEGNFDGNGEQNSLFPVVPGGPFFFFKLEALVQILLFAEISQRFHGIVGGLVSRFQGFGPKKLLNFFFSSCLKAFSYHDCKKLFSSRGWHTNLPRFQDARLDRIESLSCCFPWELVSFVRPLACM